MPEQSKFENVDVTASLEAIMKQNARPLIILIRELSGTFHTSGSSRFFTYSYLFFIRIFTFDT